MTTQLLTQLSNNDIATLMSALTSGRLAEPYSEMLVGRYLPKALSQVVSLSLRQLAEQGFSTSQIVTVLTLLQSDRETQRTTEPPIDLVTSGPEAEGVTNRDTAVVVDEMFKHAEQSVLVVGYAVYQGQKVFRSLASRMAELPDLDVTFFLDVARPKGDSTKQEILVSRFVTRFKEKQWPVGGRLPRVYYDPRSSIDGVTIRSSLHAKCVVVDGKQVFVSSANFTEAGQQRNIEVGLRIESPWLASRLTHHFTMLREHGLVENVGWG